MAAVNFPDPLVQNPATGEPYANGWYNDPATGGNGVTYVYTNGVWRAATSPSDALDDRYVEVAGDTMTGALSINDEIILNTDGSAEFAGDVQMASQNSGPLAGFRNVLINGSMDVYQRGIDNGAQTSAGYFSADRWLQNNNSTSLIFNDASLLEAGFSKALRINRSSGSPWIAQGVELPQLTNGSYRAPGPFVEGSVWTLSWWTKQDPAAPSVNFNDGVATTANNVVNTVEQPVLVESVGAWNRYSSKVTMVADTSSSTTRCLRVIINTAVGANADFEVTGIQLEPGPVATPFEHRPIGTELALCQRYYQNHKAESDYALFAVGYASNSTNIRVHHPLKVSMRAVPTFASSGASDFVVGNSTNIDITSLQATHSTKEGVQIGATVTSGITLGESYGLRANATSNAMLKFDAEL